MKIESLDNEPGIIPGILFADSQDEEKKRCMYLKMLRLS